MEGFGLWAPVLRLWVESLGSWGRASNLLVNLPKLQARTPASRQGEGSRPRERYDYDPHFKNPLANGKENGNYTYKNKKTMTRDWALGYVGVFGMYELLSKLGLPRGHQGWT